VERFAFMDAQEIRILISWVRAGILKLRGIRKGFKKGRCPPNVWGRRMLNTAEMFGNEKVERNLYAVNDVNIN
jgi:hypothetical protein